MLDIKVCRVELIHFVRTLCLSIFVVLAVVGHGAYRAVHLERFLIATIVFVDQFEQVLLNVNLDFALATLLNPNSSFDICDDFVAKNVAKVELLSCFQHLLPQFSLS